MNASARVGAIRGSKVHDTALCCSGLSVPSSFGQSICIHNQSRDKVLRFDSLQVACTARPKRPGILTLEHVRLLLRVAFRAAALFFVKAVRGLHHPEMRLCEGMKRVVQLLSVKKKVQAREMYLKMRDECLVTVGRKTGDDKVNTLRNLRVLVENAYVR